MRKAQFIGDRGSERLSNWAGVTQQGHGIKWDLNPGLLDCSQLSPVGEPLENRDGDSHPALLSTLPLILGLSTQEPSWRECPFSAHTLIPSNTLTFSPAPHLDL